LWQASEGIGVLQQALLEVQKIRRPTGDQRQSIRTDPQGGGTIPGEGVQGSGVHGEVSRERILRETCATGETRDAGECSNIQKRSDEKSMDHAPFQVRRLTVEECEFLMGFPRGYTNILGASDSARYKALGNSMAVNCMALLGERIQMVENLSKERIAA
jgi:site-specific DNA-cytosine methylase